MAAVFLPDDVRSDGPPAGALLQEVLRWARERRFGHLRLWAPVHSPTAIALYARAGFQTTGEPHQLPTNLAVSIIAMELAL
jgi:GNAT superfamily N-acetyltransferase